VTANDAAEVSPFDGFGRCGEQCGHSDDHGPDLPQGPAGHVVGLSISMESCPTAE
jgi:hypothetical protein